jgi:anti-anti-sigma factor
MQATERSLGSVTIVDVVGRLGVEHGAADFRALVARLIGDGRRDVVLNLSACHYVDSAGLGELATALVRMQKAGGRLVLLKPADRVLELLRITRLLDVFTVYSDESSAIDAVQRL